MFGRNGYQNGHRREEAEILQKKLSRIRQSAQSGDDGWRNLLRQRYLEQRLRKLVERR
jgi:pantothenate synthetase